jgi:sulfur carrier protein
MFGLSASIARKRDAMSDAMSEKRSDSDGRSQGQGARGGEVGGATVRVNGVELAWPGVGSVDELLARLGMQGKRVAVSVNRSVIPRSRHGEAPVHPGDRIEILEAVGGG